MGSSKGGGVICVLVEETCVGGLGGVGILWEAYAGLDGKTVIHYSPGTWWLDSFTGCWNGRALSGDGLGKFDGCK